VKPDLSIYFRPPDDYGTIGVFVYGYCHVFSPAEVGEKVFTELKKAIRVYMEFKGTLDFGLFLGRFFLLLQNFSFFVV
jgi:hypothetical protein